MKKALIYSVSLLLGGIGILLLVVISGNAILKDVTGFRIGTSADNVLSAASGSQNVLLSQKIMATQLLSEAMNTIHQNGGFYSLEGKASCVHMIEGVLYWNTGEILCVPKITNEIFKQFDKRYEEIRKNLPPIHTYDYNVSFDGTTYYYTIDENYFTGIPSKPLHYTYENINYSYRPTIRVKTLFDFELYKRIANSVTDVHANCRQQVFQEQHDCIKKIFQAQDISCEGQPTQVPSCVIVGDETNHRFVFTFSFPALNPLTFGIDFSAIDKSEMT